MARPLRAALIVMALATLLRLLAAALLPLSPDEAYYWQWSREPAFGYFDHPPVVAWLIALSTRLFGLSPLAVRLPAVLGATLLSVLLWHSARQRLDDSTALRLVLFLSLTPLFHLGGVIITPDTPLVLCWAFVLLGLWRATEKDRTGDWLGVGFFLGLGLLSKFSMALALPLVVWRLFAVPSAGVVRRLLVVLLPAGLIVLPYLLWLSAHDWGTLRFQTHHLTDTSRASLEGFLGFVAAQAALFSPGLLWLLVRVFRQRAALSLPHRHLLPFVWLPLLAGLVAACITHAEAGWSAVAYVGALWLVAAHLAPPSRLTRRAVIHATCWAAAFTIALYAWAFGLIGPKPPTHLSREIERIQTDVLRRLPPSLATLPMTARTYRLAALWNYTVTPDSPPVPVLPQEFQRKSHYDREIGPDFARGFLWLTEAGRTRLPAGIDPRLHTCRPGPDAEPVSETRLMLMICEGIGTRETVPDE